MIGGLMIVLSGAMPYAIVHGGIEAHEAGAAGAAGPAIWGARGKIGSFF